MQYRVTIYIIYTGTMVKEQFGCVCVLLSTSMTTIIFRDPSPDLPYMYFPHLIYYLGPMYITGSTLYTSTGTCT